MKQKTIIDFFKGMTAPVMLALLVYFQQWENVTAWIYLALHGTYGVLWVLKSRIFGDKQWEQPCSFLWGIVLVSGLIGYWVGGSIVMSQSVHAPPWLLCLCVSMFGIGVFAHFGADMQKHICLSLNPGHLIDDKLFRLHRNTNYLGELMIYLSFGLLAMHWLPLVVLASIVITIWIPNMRRKEQSLSRYKNFSTYKSRSCAFVPFIW